MQSILFGIFAFFVLSTIWLSPAISADEGDQPSDGSDFAPTVPNKLPAPNNAPNGMALDTGW